MSCLRILMVVNTYPAHQNQATGIFVKQQIKALKKYNDNIRVEVFKIKSREDSWIKYVTSVWRITMHLCQEHYDIIHVHYGLTGIPLLFQFRYPLVVTYYGSDLNNPWQRIISKLVSRRAAMNIVVSKNLRDKLSSARSVVIPYGVDTDLFRPIKQSAARRQLGLEDSRKYVLFPASRNRIVKNYPLFREAFKIIKSEYHDLEMLELSGNYSEAEVAYIMNAADVLVLTSHSEGSPQVIKEAMACNLPIVSVDVGDVREIMEGVSNSYICPRDPQDLARYIRNILESGTRSDGREQIFKLQLDSKNVTRRLLDVYHQVQQEHLVNGRVKGGTP